MKFFKKLEDIMKEAYEPFQSWHKVNLFFGMSSTSHYDYKEKRRAVITPAFIRGLNILGYDIAIVPCEKPKEKKTIDLKDYSVAEIERLAKEEGLSYGKFVSKYSSTF